MSDTLARLPRSQPCGCEFQVHGELATCGQSAHWLLNDVPVCDEDIHEIAGLNSDNETFLQPALAEIAQRSNTG
jgi:hypothetical protein